MAIYKIGNYITAILFVLNVTVTTSLSCYDGWSYEYCYGSDNDCCGSYYQYCCYTSVSGGAIAGIVIGSLIGLAIVIGIVVACICGCNKNRGMSGRVVQPGGGMGMTVINTTSNQHVMGGAPGTGYPPYGTPTAGYSQPGYNNPGPAYPPTQGFSTNQMAPPPYTAQKM